MMIFAVDDEPKMLKLLHNAIAEAEPEAEIMDFSKTSDVLNALTERGVRPDAVFSDVEMPGMDGLELAVRVKRAAPDARIIYVTGYPNYAVQAYRLHVHGFILKPVDSERIREELEQFPAPPAPRPNKLRVQCFGHFEVYWQNKPLIFSRKQSKELLAFLVDREGAACSAEDIAAALWEDEDAKAAKNRIRVLINDLRKTLRGVGMEDVLIREHRQLAIRRELVDCDYWRMLAGDVGAMNAFRGEYMTEYSWAELTLGGLHFRKFS